MIKNCYIHIPFCLKICNYCDFCKQYYQKDKVKEYLKKLKEEISSTYKGEELDTIYIGGGTPSCLDLEELEELFQITDSLKKSNNIEFTVEGNFSSITKEKLELLRKHQVNRLSLGIESTHKKILDFLGREEDKKEIKEKISLMRSLGFQNINVDLIYAVPGETIKDLEEDLDFILSLQVEHISTYSLIIEDNTILKIKGTKNIQDDLDEEMYECVCKRLKENGYIHYEISNFAKKGKESKHNLCYWTNQEYFGFGLGASSYQNSIRKTNTKSLENYPKKTLEEEKLSIEDKMEYEVILNLRLQRGIHFKEFKEKYNKDLIEVYDYKPLVKDHYLVETKENLFIQEDKIYVSNEILVKLLEKKINL